MAKPPPSPEAFRRSRRILVAVVAVLVVAGIVVAATGGDTAKTIGGFLLGLAGILAIARVFYEIGIGEDRDRARGRT